MDGSIIDHNDSDSGESWTILDNSPSYAEDAPDFPDNLLDDRDIIDKVAEKDEDTDGISIISDSDPENSAPCELNYDQYFTENTPTEKHCNQYISITPLTNDNSDPEDALGGGYDFLGDNSRHKTYVHKRNKRLSTVLNIIMLGSVITAAGVAIGHMWGAKNECPVQTTPSVNKILSNLYKLQEENVYLRSKLKELTLASHFHFPKKTEKVPLKHQRCKKVFESLNSQVSRGVTKCIEHDDFEIDKLESHMIQPAFEKEFLHDIEKLKNTYQQNKSWLDEEIVKRMKQEINNISQKKDLTNIGLKTVTEEETESRDEHSIGATGGIFVLSAETGSYHNIQNTANDSPLKIVTYADSLKSQNLLNVQKNTPPKNIKMKTKLTETYSKKNKRLGEEMPLKESTSEFEIIKDDRHVESKIKQVKNKHNRQKSLQKQKRKNKYEQWEMKGGYLKDYDAFSVTSSQDNESPKEVDSKQSSEYINTLINNENSKPYNEIDVSTLEMTKGSLNKEKEKKNKVYKWYEKRAALRTEARKKMEYELFGEHKSANSDWYFQRMQKREQCRSVNDNSTYRKQSKRHMNYKMKH